MNELIDVASTAGIDLLIGDAPGAVTELEKLLTYAKAGGQGNGTLSAADTATLAYQAQQKLWATYLEMVVQAYCNVMSKVRYPHKKIKKIKNTNNTKNTKINVSI